MVNAHVARFVVWGRQAHYLISHQPWDFAVGSGSALERLVTIDGKILLLGCDHDNVTFLHYAEHVLDIPGKRIARYQYRLSRTEQRVWREMKEVDTSGEGAHPHWPDRFFARIVDTYLEQSNNRGGLVGNAQAFLIRCAPPSGIRAGGDAGGRIGPRVGVDAALPLTGKTCAAVW